MAGFDLSTPGGRVRTYLDYLWNDHAYLRLGFQNAHWISEELVRTNQPWPHQLAEWKKAGVKTIVNLRGGFDADDADTIGCGDRGGAGDEADLCAKVAQGGGDEAADLGPLGQAVEGHNAFNHGGLLRMEDADAHTLADEEANFVLGDFDFGFGFDAEEGEQGVGGSTQQADEGSADEREAVHRAGEDAGDALGIAEADAFREELADDEREIGEDDDDEAAGGAAASAVRRSTVSVSAAGSLRISSAGWAAPVCGFKPATFGARMVASLPTQNRSCFVKTASATAAASAYPSDASTSPTAAPVARGSTWPPSSVENNSKRRTPSTAAISTPLLSTATMVPGAACGRATTSAFSTMNKPDGSASFGRHIQLSSEPRFMARTKFRISRFGLLKSITPRPGRSDRR